jgi:hypothetical protein
MTIAQEFFKLNPKQRKLVHINLCELALVEWNEFTLSKKEIKYTETVCGTDQVVEFSLPYNAVESVKKRKDIAKVKKSYLEPIVAMQDGDLQLPSDIEYAYYAIYNLFEKYIVHSKIDDWLIVNQALASLEKSHDIVAILENAIAKVRAKA